MNFASFKRAPIATVALSVVMVIPMVAQTSSKPIPKPAPRTAVSARPAQPAPAMGRAVPGARPTPPTAGRNFTPGSSGGVADFHGANGHEAHFGPDGHLRDVRANGMVISHGPGGARRVIIDRPDHSRVVLMGHNRGYIQHPYMFGGHAYFQRTYYLHGHPQVRIYRPYYFHGLYLQAYAPVHVYPHALYAWAGAAWSAPVAYQWSWQGSPWNGYYGAYFAPYPAYPAPVYWLTDYMVANSLSDAYDNQVGAAALPPAPGSAFQSTGAITPDAKAALATEIQRDIQIEQQANATQGSPSSDSATSGIAGMLSDGQQHTFLTLESLTAAGAGGQECGLGEGDVLGVNSAPGPNAIDVNVQVLSSHAGDCIPGSTVMVSIENLQDMQNEMMANLDSGLATLASQQGGLPAPPATALQGQGDALYAAEAPSTDANGATELAQDSLQADQTERAVLSEANYSPNGAPYAPPATPVTIALGQSPGQVVAAKGNPMQVVDLGAKQIFVYKDMKIIFMYGKVSDVE